ncbi:MAG: roadblock/LC7 domain-containing protein [Deltaproteobacteria bacterium]|nr:roadblock/LC7 domain-containing protein [Deltaproteobacteria bacterium]
MDAILQKLNAVSGVIGSLVCGRDGVTVACVFPPLFDTAIIEGVSSVLADPASGVQNSAGNTEILDFRYGDGRVVIKPLQDAFVLLLCTRKVNLGVLTISLNVAKTKIESLMAAAREIPPNAASVASDRLELAVCHLADMAKGSSFEQFGMAALTPATARRISSFYKGETFKRLKLTNRANGISGLFPVMIVNENDSSYDGKIILCKSIEKKLEAVDGDGLLIEIP